MKISSFEGRAHDEADSVSLAAAAVDLAQEDPREAAVAAHELVAAATPRSPGLVAARRAQGIAARELGDLQEAKRYLTAALELGTEIGAATLTALSRVTLSSTLASLGEVEAAHRQLDLAEPDLTGLDFIKLGNDRAILMWREGRINESVVSFERALADLVDHPDDLVACRVHGNYGVLLGTTGNADRGADELIRSYELASGLGQRLLQARAAANLGYVEGQRGEIVAALRWFDEAEGLYRTIAGQESGLAVLEADRAATLLQAGLFEDARDRTRAALIAAYHGQNVADTADLEILHATALLAAGEPDEALDNIRRCRDRLGDQGRAEAAWAHKLDLLELECVVSTSGGASWSNAVELAERFAGQRMTLEATQARLLAVRLALDQDALPNAVAQLTSVGRIDRLPTPALRVGGWYTTAMVRKAAGQRGSARRALRAGLRALSIQQAALGATELRVAAAIAGDDLAGLGVKLATEDQRPDEILRWIEAWRANSLRLTPVRPAPDETADALLAELREHEARLPNTSGVESIALDRSRHELEQTIRRRTWRVDGRPFADRPEEGDVRSMVFKSLGSAALVEYYEVGDDLHALLVADGRVTHTPLDGSVVRGEIAHIDAAMIRSARSGVSDSSLEAARQSIESSATTLDRHLLGPLLGTDASRRIVIVPSGDLHRLPWRCLESLRHRPTTVAASAYHWSVAQNSTQRMLGPEISVLLVAGPGMPHGDRELDALVGVWPDAIVLRGGDANVDRVRAALRTADLAHMICHGRFRADNPLFSSLQLVDGQLNVHDLQLVQPLPEVMVLPACDAARSQAAAGAELMGLSAALLAQGVRTLVAPIAPVWDEGVVDLMVDLHSSIRAGSDIAAALALADRHHDDHRRSATAAAFLVMGAGWSPESTCITGTDARS